MREPGQAVVAGPREAGPADPQAPGPDGPAAMPPHHTALRGLFLVALHHGCRLLPEQLAATDARDTLGSALRMMRGAGFRCRALSRRRWEHVAALGEAYPAMAVYRTGHWVVVIGPADGPEGPGLMVLDPAAECAGVALVPRAEFLRLCDGTLVLCRRAHPLLAEDQPFGLRWFVPEIVRHGRYFRDVATAAVASNAIGLCTPLLYHVIIDKVVPHRSYQTLAAVVAVFVLLTVFDGLFGYVRQRMMLLATNKIDARLVSRTFRHLLGLPMPFFEASAAGVLARHMQQTEKLRQFLTGRLFQTLLDAAALPLLILLLVAYSGRLTCVVLTFALLLAGLIGPLIPGFRRCLGRLYEAEGARQAHLVETIHGMRTTKSLALEPLRQQAWDGKVAAAVRRHASVGRIVALAGVLTGVLDKLMQVSVLGLGAVDVFDGRLSIGALVAFTMLAGRVSGPLVQIVGLINEYQETALSVRMLATVMDHPPERAPRHQGVRPAVTSRLAFDQVTFRYPGATAAALDRVSFEVGEGQVVGVVGRSGSGKTTLTRLIQGIQAAQEGAVRLDGVDIRHIDLAHLRRQVGVVLQDSFLFRGTIRENIAATRPDAALEEVIAAAHMAGATSSSTGCRSPTTPCSRRGPATSRAGSGSASPSRAPCCRGC